MSKYVEQSEPGHSARLWKRRELPDFKTSCRSRSSRLGSSFEEVRYGSLPGNCCTKARHTRHFSTSLTTQHMLVSCPIYMMVDWPSTAIWRFLLCHRPSVHITVSYHTLCCLMDLRSCARQNAANYELCSLRLIFAKDIYHRHLFALALMRTAEVKTASCKSKFNVWPQKNQLLKCQRSEYNGYNVGRVLVSALFHFISALCQNFVLSLGGGGWRSRRSAAELLHF